MKKFLIITVFLLLLLTGGWYFYNNYIDKIPMLVIEEEPVIINKLFVYGTHLNMTGEVTNKSNFDLVLYSDGEFLDYGINVSNGEFNISNYVNDGIYLDEIDFGNYYLFLRESYFDEVENKEKYKYYALKNGTNYDETVYYSFNKYNKKIVINSENSYPTMMIHVSKKENDIETYDIVIDPGHGGSDSGAYKYGYKESDLTMQIAEKVVNNLKSIGINAKITRTDGEFTDIKMPEYGVHGRAVIPHEVHAKYIFSIHLNSNYYSNVYGLEVYTSKNINYNFANKIVNNIKLSADTKYSNNVVNKVMEGVYSRNFTLDDVKTSIKENQEKGYLPYDVTTDATYYYIIRETGGIVTGAYVDNRNDDTYYNPYCYSNVGTEAYLLELGYMSNKDNLNNIINNMDGYVDGIVNSIKILYEN